MGLRDAREVGRARGPAPGAAGHDLQDSDEPGHDRPRAVVAGEVREGLEVGLLEDVLGGRRVVDERERHPEEDGRGRVEQGPEGLGVAGP